MDVTVTNTGDSTGKDVESVGKVQTIDADGPMAINNNFTGEGSIGFPTETMIACTWGKELAQSYILPCMR